MKPDRLFKGAVREGTGPTDHAKGRSRRWFRRLKPTPLARIAIIAGVGIHLAGFLLIEIVSEPEAVADFPPAMVQFVDLAEGSSHPIFREQAVFYDSAPLFLPTAWNYSSTVGGQMRRQGNASIFRAYPENITLGGPELQPVAGTESLDVEKPLDALKEEYWDFFPDFGKEIGVSSASSGPPGSLIIVDFRTGETVHSATLPEELRELADQHFWPVQFLLNVDATGPVGEALMLQGSGIESVDVALRAYVNRPFFTSGLGAGYYKVVIGP